MVAPAVKPNLCECGCGQPTPLAPQSSTRHGYTKGQPMRFINGHRHKAKPAQVAATRVGTGLCECGCGGRTPISTRTRLSSGDVADQPKRFLHGHSWKRQDPLLRYVVDQVTQCWNWQGRVNRYGYHGPRQAHAVVYELLRGPVPPGLELDHLCRNKRCVNPDHLEPVTQVENKRRDRIARGLAR